MPTGYTANLYEGNDETFNEFALHCARAFGALVEMRDEPFDATIPDEFHPSDYHQAELEKAKKRLKKIEGWSFTQAEREAKKAFEDEVRSIRECMLKTEKTGRAYTKMLKKAGRWLPPTKDHEGLKRFMIEQLAESLEHDCLDVPTIPRLLSGEQYRKLRLKAEKWNVAYHTKEHAKEVQRIAGRNKWVRDLRQSLEEE